MKGLAAIVGAALIVTSCPASLAEEKRFPENTDALLAKMVGAEHATYRARQIIVYFGRPQSAAVLDVHSSGSAHFVRAESGEAVMRLWRRAGLGLVSDDNGAIADHAASGVALVPRSVLSKYDISKEDAQQIFGVRVVPLVLMRRSDRAVVERLWIDPATGIAYRREWYGSSGKLVGMSAILDMDWGATSAAEPMDTEAPGSARVRTVSAPDAPSMLPHGYRLVGTYSMEASGAQTEHWVYSDGLHALSVFRRPGGIRAPSGFVATDLGGHRAWTGPGPGTWAWEGGGSSWVVVAEEPSLDAARMTEALPRGGPSMWARFGSLWARAFRAVGGVFA